MSRSAATAAMTRKFRMRASFFIECGIGRR
jgi:hypothetical protein